MRGSKTMTAAAWMDRAAQLQSQLLHMVPVRDRAMAQWLLNEITTAHARAHDNYQAEIAANGRK